MSAMIEVAGLRVVLPPAVVAVDGVDLAIRPGEFVVILGRSGAGQTTFLRFSGLSRNPKVDPAEFRFEPPKGADVLGEK